MAQKPENTFISGVHKHLDKKKVHVRRDGEPLPRRHAR